MKKFKATYSTEVISESKTIAPDGFTSIEFENIGDDDATLLSVIPLNPASKARTFTNVPPDVVAEKFKVSFAGKSENKKILVIKTFYHE